ncbi:MAG: 30S ribosome-binding factor RbfA [Flavobacteriales bacterium]|nr:30S ribosome-binding factor RbfA [Flavobacteriales bacterium]
MASIRQNKVGRLVQKELGIIFQQDDGGFFAGAMISVTIVRMAPDLSFAKVYLSIFAPGRDEDFLEIIKKHGGEIRYESGKKVGKQLRIVPGLAFFKDDSIDYAEEINGLLKS